MLNLPNALTVSRLVAIPVIMVLLTVNFHDHDQIAAAVFLLASSTDIADGNLARWRGEVTELGKFLDSLADKLFVLSVLIVLVQEGLLGAWAVVIIFGRELLITVLRSFRVSRGVVAATPFGKTKMVVQSVAVLLVILQRPYPSLTLLASIMVGAAVVFTVASGVDYLWRFRKVWWGPEPESMAPAEQAAALETTLTGVGPDPLALQVGERLKEAGLTISVAESCTGGLLAGAITDLPGSSAWFLGGVVAYSNQVKHEQLGVPQELLDRCGAVSAEVAEAMAAGVRRVLGTDMAVAVTGIAGPGADGSSKPVGLTHIWVDGPDRSGGRRFVFPGDRWENRRQAVREALGMVLERASMLDKANRHS